MTITALLIQTGVTFVAASLGAIFGAFLARRMERFKHLQELRSTAYADFLRGFAKAARAQSDTMRDERSMLEELEGRVIVTDSRSRIAIYGGKDVVHALSKFIKLGTQTQNPDGMQAFTELCMSMRSEAGMERTSFDDIDKVLFS
jgi:ATP-dependent protease HslVU (ClpYQ) peptidase subunit